VAGDDRVGVFDVRDGTDRVSSNGNDTEEHVYARTRCIRLLECHSDRVKRIVTEESPDLFLTVSEVLSTCALRLTNPDADLKRTGLFASTT